jgi:rare lipoprotein A
MRVGGTVVMRVGAFAALAAGSLVLANCSGGMSGIDPRYGVSASPRVVEDGQAVPKGGGVYRVGKPYVVGGRVYVPEADPNYSEVGLASWYGSDFHGRYTANGEIFDKESISAAHPTLPLPSYARVTSIASGKSVVVRINDRGPFLHGRIIDLSYAAAHRIGIAMNGSGEVDVEAILPGTLADAANASQPPLAPVAAAPVATTPYAPPTTAAVAVVSDPDAPPLAPVSGGYSVQLGAFANFANAQAFLARAQNQLATAQVEAKIRQAGGLYRVYIGPYPARNDAERVGDRIAAAFGFATTIAPHPAP